MSNLEIAIAVLIVMTIVGLIFGLVLAFANKKFSIEINPLIHIVEDILPKGQCGACGFAGCMAYAEAVVMNDEVPPNLCVPGKAAVAKLVAELTGKAALEVEPKVAFVHCAGSTDKANKAYEYKGVQDCVAASLLQGGPKGCQYGCLGFGTCVNNCPFDAMTMGDNGLPIIDEVKCTGCGKCKSVCPKKVIDLVSPGIHVAINCNSKDKGAVARKLCTIACIGCGICVKNCSHGAIKIENNLAVVDSKICMAECSEATCTHKCPTGAIKTFIKEAPSANIAAESVNSKTLSE
ncbi:RnfABCDGE type electron transport complex subunit B [Clostridium estertheticum]|uniref:RnfABCDGE type electron transport complex subunit B n=1 Tax=Clostridium estertheticum TaxID=238834 RepID=UPI001CF3A35E|nr:Fe-S cluster domain-containing protein [Clostridium estertheticum]MCB2340001.1 Fe-S cluster domain-containing protein [Clostridium estertheticum]MCB2352600.1 Fe-S cluster domain-containing protein [Clostridium estertheticum]WAG39912.1 Fe-S cluster domain-containing protein [Clostridium estertheticum]